ncbi:site-specific integrase [Candidatus Solincola tengchongensis]|uniref:tyrosine-type recombinase/integrase n=1 Tax=Candidatus Solincola tengchongensis TaxID=2900693 RepID=UPI00257A61DA|nr:site-specific integrase [Candidatus Solincola tengchongensis]
MSYIRRREYPSGKVSYAVAFKDQHGRWREVVAGSRRKDAEVLLRRISQEVAAGTWGRKEENPTLSEFSRSFLEAKKDELKPSTLKDYSEVVHNHILPILGRLRLKEITPLEVQEFLLRLQEKGVSSATTGKVYRVLKVILRRAVALELLDRDPTVGISPPRVERKEMRFLTPEEVNRLLEATEGTDIGDLIAVAVMTGLRQGELLGLRWRDVDLPGRRINVVRSWHAVSGHTDLKTASSRRTVPIPQGLLPILEARHRRMGFPPPSSPVFPEEGKSKDRRNLIAREFEPALERAGLPRIRFHDLRHTFASLAIEGGVDLKSLQAVMGHANITTTAHVYGHVYDTHLERVGKGVELALQGGLKVIRLARKDRKDAPR